MTAEYKVPKTCDLAHNISSSLSSSSSLHPDLHQSSDHHTTARHQRQRKIAFERAKKVYKIKIINKLRESQEGRQLLLGRTLFKQQRKQRRRQAQGNKKSDSPLLPSTSSSDDRNHQNTNNNFVLKYLEHRAIRQLATMKERQRNINNLALHIDNDCCSVSMMTTTLFKNLLIQQHLRQKLSSSETRPDENISSSIVILQPKVVTE